MFRACTVIVGMFNPISSCFVLLCYVLLRASPCKEVSQAGVHISVQPGSLYWKFLKLSGTADSEKCDF